jgi:hypothetical protein
MPSCANAPRIPRSLLMFSYLALECVQVVWRITELKESSTANPENEPKYDKPGTTLHFRAARRTPSICNTKEN